MLLSSPPSPSFPPPLFLPSFLSPSSSLLLPSTSPPLFPVSSPPPPYYFLKLFGLDSNSGNIVWQKYLPELHPFANGKLLLYSLRSSSHLPHPPLVVVLGAAPASCNGSMAVYLDPLTGQLEGDHSCLPYHVAQALLLPLTDSSHQRLLLVLSKEGMPHCIPSTCSLLTRPNSSAVFLFTADPSTGILRGMEVVEEREEQKEVPKTRIVVIGINGNYYYYEAVIVGLMLLVCR